MKPLSSEWVQKADGDFKVAMDEWGLADPVLDAVCFHSQQCIEKYLKACLVEKGLDFPRIHDLQTLSGLISPFWPEVNKLTHEMALLGSAAVEIRYPGASAVFSDAEEAVAAMKKVRDAARVFLQI
jgi:HEPN domain-containing protein